MNTKTVTIIILIGIAGILMFNFLSKKSDMDLSSEQFKEQIGDNPGLVIDVRTADEYEAGHLAMTDARYDWLNGEFQDAVEELDREKTYYLYCRSGNRSGQAAKMMKQKGFENVYNIGGFQNLANSGLEVRTGNDDS